MVKTVDLPANGMNYMAICHPHSAMALSHGFAFGTEGIGITDHHFPGLRSYIFALGADVLFPIMRELYSALGRRKASDQTMTGLLSTTSNTIAALVVGGMREQTVQKSDQFCLVVRRRRGFCRIALKTGTQLVPMIAFGEDRSHTKIDHRFFTKLYLGRWYSPVPLRVPITMVFGPVVEV